MCNLVPVGILRVVACSWSLKFRGVSPIHRYQRDTTEPAGRQNEISQSVVLRGNHPRTRSRKLRPAPFEHHAHGIRRSAERSGCERSVCGERRSTVRSNSKEESGGEIRRFFRFTIMQLCAACRTRVAHELRVREFMFRGISPIRDTWRRNRLY